jgi:hypothetical protein
MRRTSTEYITCRSRWSANDHDVVISRKHDCPNSFFKKTVYCAIMFHEA